MNRYWIYIFIGAFFEVIWVTGLKHADTTMMWIGTIIAMYISFHLVISASTKLPVGTVYAVFTGMGTAGTVLVEMLVFGEPFRFLKVFLILLLLSGVFGLKFVTKEQDKKGAAV
ncbi:multidrug efflux SMR transporter [Paenibacillus alginolyticus]|uniref:Multidrug efflux SMR transporter n=1 Tax=Paenibacillus alginolyticus TaxID=59839 RepID=A0ABT4GQF0_9BACL|nr:multidrug efflux SMR transporter [Paenibacillus alginolyticus]MCY9664335.1 multidrug efflux SMR transporter [Paenibacillus alginolyticus]MCY9698465.1 multidrug efflux SMR transporter [Paenibacillus alginolyticus]MEC0148451.1 multidrug efflux SMR transporter [Paenibacillus alginolyticus]